MLFIVVIVRDDLLGDLLGVRGEVFVAVGAVPHLGEDDERRAVRRRAAAAARTASMLAALSAPTGSWHSAARTVGASSRARGARARGNARRGGAG